MGNKGNKRRRGNSKPPPSNSAESFPSIDDAALDPFRHITIDHKNITFAGKLSSVKLNKDKNLALTYVSHHDSIHPHSLAFPPPLAGFSTTGKSGFRHQWEKLSYAFNLPDPRIFPELPILPADKSILDRFITVCQTLASYSVINQQASLSIKSAAGKNTVVSAKLPTHEEFGGTSVTFRQLHSSQEEASFDKAQGILFKTVKIADQEKKTSANSILKPWVEARRKLMSQTLPTIVSRKLISEVNESSEFPVSFSSIKPDEIIRQFNYGEFIHWGSQRDSMVDLMDDPDDELYYKYALTLAITGLAHLYFGFSILAKNALGEPQAPQK